MDQKWSENLTDRWLAGFEAMYEVLDLEPE